VFWEEPSPVVVVVVWRAGVERGGVAVQQRPGATQGNAAEAEASGRAAVKLFAPRWAVWANYGL
jgi:hypothetical protein